MATTTTPPITKQDVARSRAFGIRLPETPAKPETPPAPNPNVMGTCSLSLRINGVRYGVRKIEVEFGLYRAFRLTKVDGESHDVIDGVHGAECSCPSYVWRHDGLDNVGCKHVRASRAVGLID